MSRQILLTNLKRNCFQDFSEFDDFKNSVLDLAVKKDIKLKRKFKKASKFEDADPEDVYPGIEEEYYRLESYERVMCKVLVVLFYSRLEIRLKKILTICDHAYTVDNIPINRFDFKKIAEAFKEIFSIVIQEVISYDEFNELRVVNNCLKHSEIVSDELEHINPDRWHKGNPIDLTKDDLDRLLPKSKEFYKNLLDELKKKLAEE